MNKIGIILAVLLLLVTIQSTFFFLGALRVNFIEWIVFNACAPSNITFLIGFTLFLLLKDRTIIHMAILPMFFFGVGGLIIFPWSGMNIIPQIGHIIMALNIGWTILATIKTADYKAATVGLLLGIAIFSFFIGFQQNYVASHPEDFKRIMQME
ncbi:MAG: hypothetical protein A2Y65_09275 [Deltaproteobacteria bacterium RBG_13_52_11]|nr:MAG: hypothetical protein A2Y65_09275 [Deltaproteobacteria bacterium RBG_13_52_11]